MFSTNGKIGIKEKLKCTGQVLSFLWMTAETVETLVTIPENHRKAQPPKAEIDSQDQSKKVKWTKVIYSIKMFNNIRVFNSAKVKYIQIQPNLWPHHKWKESNPSKEQIDPVVNNPMNQKNDSWAKK